MAISKKKGQDSRVERYPYRVKEGQQYIKTKLNQIQQNTRINLN